VKNKFFDMDLASFDPSGIGLNNGNFIGLPFSENDAKVILIPVPLDVTVSYSEGTAMAPDNIRKASLQLDLFQPEIKDAWKLGIFLKPTCKEWENTNKNLRLKAKSYIEFLENGGDYNRSEKMQQVLSEINERCGHLHRAVYLESQRVLEEGKLAAVVGGDHSAPLGLLKAISEVHRCFGVLHIDAHMDLRKSYESFTFSHASIFNNAISEGYVSQLVQVGIRDFCDQEVAFANEHNVVVFYDDKLKENSYKGMNWHAQCQEIISGLPQKVYVSFDIDGLNPYLCPNTGTPVPGGLEFSEATFLIKELVKSGREIIGFDLCEVGGEHEWDGNVGARLLYFLSNWAGRSKGWV
jgi:agmatinase